MAKAKQEHVSIGELWRGPSGQPPWQRKPGQINDGQNVRFDPAEGISTREPTRFVADLSGWSDADFDHDGTYAFFGFKDLVVAIGVKSDSAQTKTIHAWDLDGNPVEVVDTLTNDSGDVGFEYLPDDPDDLAVAIQHDTMVICNRAKEIDYTDGWSDDEIYSYIRDGYPNSGRTSDGEHASSPVDYFSDLPSDPVNSVWARVKLDEDANPAGYYMRYDSGGEYPYYNRSTNPDSNIFTTSDELFPNHGNWFRISKPDQGTARPDPATFPHRLVYDGTALYWCQVGWRPRLSGANATNPRRSICGGTSRERYIKGVAFYQTRFFMLGIRSIVGSASSDYFNFYNDNINVPTDADPVDKDIGFANTGQGRALAECGERLMVFCEAAQIEFGSGDEALTAINGRMQVVTRHSWQDVRPAIKAGQVTMLDAQNDVHQFTYHSRDYGVVYTGQLNIHDRRRFYPRTPEGLFHVQRLLYLTDATLDAIMHQQFEVEGSTVQSAWWDFRTQGRIVFAYEWEAEHILITSDDDEGFAMVKWSHEELPPPGDMSFYPALDHLEEVTGVYDESTHTTAFSHTGRTGSLARSRVVLNVENYLHHVLVPDSIDSNGDVVVNGRWDSVPDVDSNGDRQYDSNGDEIRVSVTPYVGFTYDSEAELTKLWAGLHPAAVLCNRFFVFFHRSTDWKLRIERPGNDDVYIEWQSTQLGEYSLGEPYLETGAYDVPGIGDVREATLTLVHDSPGRATWSGLMYVAEAGGYG